MFTLKVADIRQDGKLTENDIIIHALDQKEAMAVSNIYGLKLNRLPYDYDEEANSSTPHFRILDVEMENFAFIKTTDNFNTYLTTQHATECIPIGLIFKDESGSVITRGLFHSRANHVYTEEKKRLYQQAIQFNTGVPNKLGRPTDEDIMCHFMHEMITHMPDASKVYPIISFSNSHNNVDRMTCEFLHIKNWLDTAYEILGQKIPEKNYLIVLAYSTLAIGPEGDIGYLSLVRYNLSLIRIGENRKYLYTIQKEKSDKANYQIEVDQSEYDCENEDSPSCPSRFFQPMKIELKSHGFFRGNSCQQEDEITLISHDSLASSIEAKSLIQSFS